MEASFDTRSVIFGVLGHTNQAGHVSPTDKCRCTLHGHVSQYCDGKKAGQMNAATKGSGVDQNLNHPKSPRLIFAHHC